MMPNEAESKHQLLESSEEGVARSFLQRESMSLCRKMHIHTVSLVMLLTNSTDPHQKPHYTVRMYHTSKNTRVTDQK